MDSSRIRLQLQGWWDPSAARAIWSQMCVMTQEHQWLVSLNCPPTAWALHFSLKVKLYVTGLTEDGSALYNQHLTRATAVASPRTTVTSPAMLSDIDKEVHIEINIFLSLKHILHEYDRHDVSLPFKLNCCHRQTFGYVGWTCVKITLSKV